MPAPIEFWFDFSSPYSYLASEKIEELAARYGRTVAFKPTLLGVIFRTTGGVPLTELVPPKANYFVHDFERSARFAGVPFRKPSVFPIATVNAARAFVWLQQRDEALAARFLHAAFRAYFAQDRNLAEPEVLAAVASEVGVDPVQLARGIQEPAIKERLKALVDESIARGVFGAPTIFVDGEMFWGHDRLPQVERWLASGPF
ncbi:MAG: 2-hydroxychromene-2-carboxylate isomerase [Burkholderiales bacterium]|jgi:2-hydroxychromene-2-carboxylate isomerase|nr:2-hydroxychromene-2-carboxylate isomerase [Burkholderiales bacterium]